MLFAVVLGARADKHDPVLSFSPNDTEYTTVAGTTSFKRPTLTISDTDGTPIRSRFRLTWTVVDSNGKSPKETNDSEGKRIYKDPTTGVSVQKVYGVVTIGDKVGDVTIKATATPMPKWADTYNTVSASYVIHVTAPEINYAVYESDEIITTESTQGSPVNVYTYYDKKAEAYNSMKRALPKMHLWHKVNDITIDDDEKYDITYSFAKDDKFEVKDSNFTANAAEIKNAKDIVKGTLTITAQPKEGYDTNIFKKITYVVYVQAKYLDGSTKLKTYIKFVKDGKNCNEQTHYRLYRVGKQTVREYSAPANMPEAIVVDEYGNDITSAYVLSYGSYKDGKFQNGLVYGQDVLHKYSEDPLDSYDKWKDYKEKSNDAAITVSSHTSNATYKTDGGVNNLMASTHPDDYIVTVRAFVKKPNDANLNKIGWYHDPDGTVPDFSSLYADTAVATPINDINGMLYDTNHENKYTNLKTNNLVFHMKKRSATIQFSPDPSTVKLANNYTMTPTNRFHVLGVLADETMPGLSNDTIKLTGSKGFNGGDDGFSYCVFIPKNRLWQDGDGTNPSKVMIKVNELDAALVEKDVNQLVPVIGEDGKETGKYETVTGNRYFSKELYGNDNLNMTFYGTGTIPMIYNLIPWNSQNWDISQSKAIVFNVDNLEPTKLIVDPKVIYTPMGTPSIPPSFKVEDQFGSDITEHFIFNLSSNDIDNNNSWRLKSNYLNPNDKTKIVADFGSYTPYQAGTVSISAKATKRNKENSPEEDSSPYKDPENTEIYEVITKGGWTQPVPTYEVIYDANEFNNGTGLNDDNKKTKMGKLHFIKAGDMYPGTQAYQEVPGINITFGSPNESDNYKVTSETFDATASPDLKDNDNDKGSRCLIDIPNVTFEAQGENQTVEPATGYIRIDAITNGWLTIDGDFDNPSDNTDSRYYTLRNLTTGISQNLIIEPGKSKKGEYRFPMALLAGNAYALYCIDGMKIHGIDFDPAFISLPTDHDAWHTAVSFQNGYTGNLPTLRDGTYATIQYYLRDVASTNDTKVTDITAASGVAKGLHAGIDAVNGKVTSIRLTGDNTLSTTKGAEMDNRVSIVARVLGKNNSGKQVEKRPHYNLFIGDMPTYVVADGEQFDQGNRLSTTNIPTRIWMTIGGWKHGMSVQDDFPYYKNNDKSSIALADSWDAAKMDSTGRDNMTIDNFNYQVTGNQNPMDEDVKSWTSGKKNTFCVPVRGTYLKFEPEESGKLFVYILQNGMSDLASTDPGKLEQAAAQQDGDDPGNKQAYRLRRRAMYIVDESGKNVELADGNDDWGSGMDKYLPGANTVKSRFPGYTYTNKNYYSDGMLRIGWNYDGGLNGNHTLKFCKQGEDPNLTGDFRNYPKDRENIETWWKGNVTYNGTPHDRLNGPLEVLKLQDGSYAIPTKGYVRYTFNVKAGKTYFMFVSGSKLGFCGFGFLPVGYSKSPEEWLAQSTGTKSEDERSFAETVLDKLPEPVNEVYQDNNDYGGDDVTLSATNFAGNANSYANLSEDIKKRSFVNVNLKRKFLNKRWAGICLPFTVSEHQVKEIFGENSSIITFDSIRANKNGVNPVTGEKEDQSRTIHFTRHVAQIIEAGRPYFIYPNVAGIDDGQPIGQKQDDGTYMLTFKHVSFENKDTMNVIGFNEAVQNYNKTAAEGKKIDIFTYKACGIYDAASAPQYSYFMKTSENKDENYLSRLVSDNAKKRILYGYNTYLYPYSDDAEGKELVETTSKAKMATFWIRGAEVNGGETTGIDELNGLVDKINIDQTNFVSGVYTVDGVRVRSNNTLKGLAPGVYIMGGKKYTVE